MLVSRVVSGGQSGVDRAALDAAVACGVPYGGWCPRGGWAEDRPHPPGLLRDYPLLRETPDADPAVRTRWNVRDSDATLVLAGPSWSPGTALTVAVAVAAGRPHLTCPLSAPDRAQRWLRDVGGGVLNVAGPRESEWPGSYRAALDLLVPLLSAVGA